jgi:hypothetical protein
VFIENGRKMSHIFLLDINHMMVDPSAGQYGFKVSNGIYVGDFNKCQYFKAKKSIKKISNNMFKYYSRYVETHDKYKNLSEVELKSKYNISSGDIDNLVILDLLSKDVTAEQILQQIKK